MSGDTTYSAFICKRFHRLGSATAVAQAHQIPYHVVLRILHEEGVQTKRGRREGSVVNQRSRKVSDETRKLDRNFIRNRYETLGSVAAVTRTEKIPYHIVLRILHEQGVRTNRGPVRGSGKNAVKYQDLDPQFVRNSYDSLGSAFAVSRTHQIPYPTVLRILHEEGVNIKQGPTKGVTCVMQRAWPCRLF